MNVYLNEITGMADGLVSLYFSKRTWTREKEVQIRKDWKTYTDWYGNIYDKDLCNGEKEAMERTLKTINSFCKYAWLHTTMLDFVTISVTVEGIHRAGQDDWDAHACRFNNRIIRASTRLADFAEGEMSDFYKDKIIPTDVALKMVGQDLPNEFVKYGNKYVKTVNGYIREDLKDNRDVKRGLYMESIPSNFIFKCNMAQWAHVYKLRNKNGTANPEVKQLAEAIQDQIEEQMPWFNREFLAKVQI